MISLCMYINFINSLLKTKKPQPLTSVNKQKVDWLNNFFSLLHLKYFIESKNFSNKWHFVKWEVKKKKNKNLHVSKPAMEKRDLNLSPIF